MGGALRRGTLVMAAAVVAALAFACGGDDDPEPTPTPTVVAGTPDPSRPTPAPPIQALVSIEAKDRAFEPTSILAPVGIVVRLTLANLDDTPHTLTVYADEDFLEPLPNGDTGEVGEGAIAKLDLTFEEGEYYYRCEIHPDDMQGQIVAND